MPAARKKHKTRADRAGSDHGLNARQIAFAHEYSKDRNATNAARRAGYSKKTASQQGYSLLVHPQIKALIDSQAAKTLERLDVSAYRIRKKLAEIAFEDLDDDAAAGRHAVQVRALELLGKDAGLFVERVEHSLADLPDVERLRRRDALETAVRERLRLTAPPLPPVPLPGPPLAARDMTIDVTPAPPKPPGEPPRK